MPTLVIVATQDAVLAEAWERQLAPGRTALRLEAGGLPHGWTPGLAAVVVLDAVLELALPPLLARCPTIYVGEPKSVPFEQARMAKRAKVFLSYEESESRLSELLPLMEEMAEKQSVVEMLTGKARRIESARPIQRTPSADAAELWDFLEGAVENLDSRDRLVAEFRRASRSLLRASHAVFFLREADGFRADRGTSFFSGDDPMVGFFENHPAVIDGTNWDGPADPVAELAVRNRLALWGARLLVPVHDNGRLLGLIALGIRDDGQPYDEPDRNRAVFFARLFRHFLAKSYQFARLNHIANQVTLGAKYLPATLVLGANENAPRHVPLVVRDLIGHARRNREISRTAAGPDQPFRASAGIIQETGGAWAFWEEASGEVHEARARERRNRLGLLRELALTLNHQLGNALVSLTTFRQATEDRPMPLSLVNTVKADVVQLEGLNNNLALMQSMNEGAPTEIDVRAIAEAAGHSLGIRVESGPDPIPLVVDCRLLDLMLRSVIQTVVENRPDQGVGELTLKIRSTGTGSDSIALVSIRGRNLQLEGVLPEPVEESVPNQGRLSVFLAQEILRLHHGEMHAGPGAEGTEILISFRNW